MWCSFWFNGLIFFHGGQLRKIDQDADLNDYTDINDDGEIEIVNSLMEKRSKLLLNDLKGAKMSLERDPKRDRKRVAKRSRQGPKPRL